MHISRPTCALAILAAVGITACDSDDGGGTPPVEPASIVVVADRADDALRDRLLEIATDYLERIAGIAPGVVRLSPPSSSATVERIIAEAGAGLALVLDAERLAGDRVPAREIADLPEGGYRLVTDQVGGHANSLVLGDHGATVVYLAGESRLARQYALYEALRRLGVRYYHPEEEYVPRVPADQLRARAATPTALARPGSDDYLPDFRFRGFTFHGPHPLEQLEAFSDGDFPIDEAVHVTEWSIKNRGETFRGPGRGVASAEARAKRSQELEDLRHFYGMTVGTGITLHNVQQGGRPQIDPSSPIPVQEQIETLVEERFATTPDATQFGIHFGPTEVSVTPDIETVQWINWAGARALELRPDIPVIINNHTSGGQAVDNFSDLGCPPGTNDRGVVDYYDLAYHTDPRLGISVHTVMLPPLEGPAFVYNQVTFAHKLCLMQRASAEGRPLEWFPESSWWLSYDNPIPVYLPLYMKTRRRDIELVTPLLENRGGTVRRHKQFNSGHEWGYWQQDYAVGMWHWNVDVSLDDVLGELADPMCDPAAWPDSCAARDELVAVLDEVMQQQQADFLDDTDQAGRPGGLFTYFTGEDPAEELSVRAGFTFHPQPVTFPEVASWDEQEAQPFRDGDLADLTRMASSYAAWTDRLNAIEASVPEAGLPWLREVRDGVEINGLRAAHVAKLFEAILAFAAAERRDDEDPAASATPLLESAAAIMADAEQVIRRREQAYRYPAEQVYGGGLTAETAVPNGTTYEYRVHTKTHLLTYWHIRQDRAQDVVDGEMLDPTQILLEPVFADPGTSLTIDWPDFPTLDGAVSLGDGTEIDPSVTEHTYGDPFVYPITGSIEIDGTPLPVEGFVARTERRAASPVSSLSLIHPSDPVAIEFIRGISPAFYFAADRDDLAIATDVTGSGRFLFSDVEVGAFDPEEDPFHSSLVDLDMQLVGIVGGDGSPRFIGLGDVTFSAQLDENGFGETMTVEGNISARDVVDLLVELVGFDEQGAYAFLATVYGVTVEELPENPPFQATLPIQNRQ